MRSDAKKSFYFHTDANSLGGFIEEPFKKIIPSQAAASLPPVGGYATTRTEAFNFEEIISCRSAYTRVSGREVRQDGPWSVLVTSVVEELNILEIVKAERVVAQLSVDYQREGGFPRISLTGSHFEHLRIGGYDAFPAMNPGLMDTGRDAEASRSRIPWSLFQKTGREQAGKVLKSVRGDKDAYASRGLAERFEWMDCDRDVEDDELVLCSLVDGVDREIPGTSFCHVLEIPEFGRIFLGELLVSPASIQLTMVRAELGCNVHGQATAASGGVRGTTMPP
jgi:hypothetical protein